MAYELLLIDGAYTTPAICKAYRDKIAKYAVAARGRLQGGRTKTSNAYDAYDYRKSHPWVKDAMTDRFATSMTASATAALNSLTEGRADQATSIDTYLVDSVDACGLAKTWAVTKSNVSKADSLGRKITRKAKTKPWYPRGYFQLARDLAGRWNHGAADPCSFACAYWTLDVYSKGGCPNGVYVELDIRRNGVSVDWDNDSLGYLGPRRTGRLQFVTYQSGSFVGSVNEANCY